MDNPAALSDVEGSFERSLTGDEKRVVPAWLGTAWRTLNREVRGIPARCNLPADVAGYLPVDDVRDIVVAMVERKLRNPDAMRSWNGDTEGGTIDSTLSSGQIYVTDTEKASLLPVDVSQGATGMFSIQLGRP